MPLVTRLTFHLQYLAHQLALQREIDLRTVHISLTAWEELGYHAEGPNQSLLHNLVSDKADMLVSQLGKILHPSKPSSQQAKKKKN